jgi:hypothetical protein
LFSRLGRSCGKKAISSSRKRDVNSPLKITGQVERSSDAKKLEHFYSISIVRVAELIPERVPESIEKQ